MFPKTSGNNRIISEPGSADFRSAIMTENSDAKNPTTVLVIEPDILVRMVICEYLRGCGYKVIEGVTGDDVTIVLESEHQIDIVFAEVGLAGGIDGFGIAQWVRQNHPDVEVILTSTVANAAAKAEDLCNEGPVGKPYSVQEVVRRINVALQRRRSSPTD
jgi:CheY-like chemotaxis protein